MFSFRLVANVRLLAINELSITFSLFHLEYVIDRDICSYVFNLGNHVELIILALIIHVL